MRSLKFTLAYDGTHFSGWQVQDEQRTVQLVLEQAWKGVAGESIRVTATLIDVNGLYVLPLLLAPVLLTALAALVAIVIHAGLVRRGALILASAVLLLGFCAVGIFTIGMFFLPAAIAVGFSGVIGLTRGSS